MNTGDEVILAAGALSLLTVLAGFASTRVGTPLLLSLIGVGVLAGEDGPGGIKFDDFRAAYLVGSLSLAVILFQGGLNTDRDMIRKALWPSVALATIGVAVSTAVVGVAAVFLFRMSWPEALLLGAATAPTDAAAITVLLRFSGVRVPSRLCAALELESGLNDPMSVFLTLGLLELLTEPAGIDARSTALLFLKEMGGGLAIGLFGGYALLRLFRWLRMERSAFPVLALGYAFTVFGGAQVLGASGFLATYLAALVVGNFEHPADPAITHFFDTLGWLAQNTLFLMLGLLVTPHNLMPVVLPSLAVSAVLMLLARPAAVMLSLLPFRWTLREGAFVAWAGLRGAVPIYLSIISLLHGAAAGAQLFEIVFVVVIVSVAVQGWTVKPVAWLLRLQADKTDTSGH